jgi:ABC-type Na+ efflux pump permease subunit
MMLGRMTAGLATPLEVVLSIVLLAFGIVAALWVAARIYAAGVLLYGQRPGVMAIWRLVRKGT